MPFPGPLWLNRFLEKKTTGPDLALSDVTATPATVLPGDRITLSAQVVSDGLTGFAVKTVRIYRHTHTTDTPRIGGTETKALGKIFLPGAASDVSMGDTAPTTPATYYYYFCVDPLTDEQNTDNNCSVNPCRGGCAVNRF